MECGNSVVATPQIIEGYLAIKASLEVIDDEFVTFIYVLYKKIHCVKKII